MNTFNSGKPKKAKSAMGNILTRARDLAARKLKNRKSNRAARVARQKTK